MFNVAKMMHKFLTLLTDILMSPTHNGVFHMDCIILRCEQHNLSLFSLSTFVCIHPSISVTQLSLDVRDCAFKESCFQLE